MEVNQVAGNHLNLLTIYGMLPSDMAAVESTTEDGTVVSNDLIAIETWHQLEIVYNSQAGTFDVYINGEFSQANTYSPISGSGWGKDFSLRGANQSGIKTVYFDNIEIYSLP